MDVDASEVKIFLPSGKQCLQVFKTSPKTPTHFPNYLRSTLSSANKAINASISFQTAEGSPACHCPKMKNPRNPIVTKPFNSIPAVKKLGILEPSARKNIDQTRNNRNIEELLPIDDNVVFVNEPKIKRKPKLRHDFLILLTRDIKRSESDHRPVRSRVMPLRPWLGEHAFYSIDERGLSTLERTECPQLKDRKLLRYISKHEKSV
ncbi:unnamed protein product [Auanema sp. JU1783]|nr:unnamed protein product [Auanema sp. JU1783]